MVKIFKTTCMDNYYKVIPNRCDDIERLAVESQKAAARKISMHILRLKYTKKRAVENVTLRHYVQLLEPSVGPIRSLVCQNTSGMLSNLPFQWAAGVRRHRGRVHHVHLWPRTRNKVRNWDICQLQTFYGTFLRNTSVDMNCCPVTCYVYPGVAPVSHQLTLACRWMRTWSCLLTFLVHLAQQNGAIRTRHYQGWSPGTSTSVKYFTFFECQAVSNLC